MEYVPIDIETTGVTAKDTVTVIGFATEDGFDIYYRIPEGETFGEHTEPTPNELRDRLPSDIQDHMSITAFETEKELLEQSVAMFEVDAGFKKDDYTLVGFNSDGFDFPTLRTMCLLNNIVWPYTGRRSLDISETYRYKFQTKKPDISGLNMNHVEKFGNVIGAPVNSNQYKSELVATVKEHGYEATELDQFLSDEGLDLPTSTEDTLDGIFDLLVGEEIEDPFDSSAEAVSAFNNGKIEDLLLHNIIDLYKTKRLTEVVLNYVNESEIRTRML